MSSHNDQLRQRLLEMLHGLLSDVETAELRERICSDPEIARAYSEVSIEADVIAKAARLEGAKVELPNRSVTRIAAAARSGPGAWMPWVVYLALSLLVAVTLGGYVWDRSQRRDVAGDHMRLLVTGPATITPGVESRVTVRTESITGEPLPASIELSLVSLETNAKGTKQERQLLASADRIRRSDASGQPTEFIIPANLTAAGLHGLEAHATPSLRLEVLAHSGPSHPRFSRDIEIEPERFITQVSLDKPWYQPGETVYFRSLTLEGLSLSAQHETSLEFEILDPDGSPVAGSKSQGVTERGVGNGAFALDAGLAEGEYTLVVRNLGRPAHFHERKKAFRVRSSIPSAPQPNPMNLDNVTVDFYPEGGDLVEGLSNRVYFAALDPAGEPVHVEGDVVDSAGRAVAAVTTVKDGRGSFTFTPIKGQNYQLKFRKPENVKSIAALPSANPLRTVVLMTGGGDSGAPLTLAITAKQASMPLVVTATCRGAAVGQTTLITGEAGVLNVVTLPLAAAADGVIRVTVHDYSGPKPEPIAERLWFRRGTRKLSVMLAEQQTKFRPGQKAELKLKVTDERGRPVAATLGVVVVDDALLALAKEQTKHQPATIPTQFRLASEIEKPEQLEDVNFYLSDDPKAAESLDLLLGTQGWRRFASQRLDELVKNKPDAQTERAALEGMLTASGPGGPPMVYDNLDEIRGPYERQLLEYETAQRARLTMIGQLAFYGGIAVLLGIAALGLVQLLGNPRIWVPAMSVATACLIVGGLWMKTPQPEPNGATAVAVFRANDERAATNKDPDPRRNGNRGWIVKSERLNLSRFPNRQYAYRLVAGQSGVRTDFPKILYWNPRVIANSDGEATIRFDVPDIISKFPVSKFRVVADAHCEELTGDGRSSAVRIGTGGGMIEVIRE